jgi:mRNA-degrading endonuclease YafQ of YafQ-DinJ toxin-antitoxin module
VKVSYSNRFRKAFQNKCRNNPALQEKFFRQLEIFLANPFHPALRTHKLSGKLRHLSSFSVDYDMRVIFSFVSKNEVILEDIGTHDEVY